MSAIDAGPAWVEWARVTPVIGTPAPSARYVRVVLPPAISPGSDGRYADLRVADGGGEVPYALDPQRTAESKVPVALIDTGFIPHRGTQGVVDLGASGALVDGITLDIDTSRKPTYFERVAIDASDDRLTWRIVRDDAILYRVEQDNGRGNATLTFPATRSRWLRIRVLDPGTPFPMTGAHLATGGSREPALVRLPVAPTETDDKTSHDQIWTFTLRTPMRPTAVTFADGRALYERKVTVEAGDDGTQAGFVVGEAMISHYAEGGAQTTVPLEERTARFVKVTVHNGNDAPLRTLHPALLARPHEVVFAPHAAAYRLLSGNPNVDAPSYDLGSRLAHETWQAVTLRAGETVDNAGFRDRRPIGERFPWLITGTLLIVAVALGWIALRVVKPARAP